MARVTVEDCMKDNLSYKFENRFDLLLVAVERAKDISSGEKVVIDRHDDKETVVALREIAADKIDVPYIKDKIVGGLAKIKMNKVQYQVEADEEDLDTQDNSILSESEISLDHENIYIDEELDQDL